MAEHDISITPGDTSLKTLRLYYPTSVSCYEKDWYGDSENEPTELTPRQSAKYLNEVLARIAHEQDDDEMERGLMLYYTDDDTVNKKIISARPSAEIVDHELYGVAVLRITDGLTADEMSKFKDYWTGQMADGYGEGFEQREIRCSDGNEIYVSFWSFSDSWSIKTMDEIHSPQSEIRPMDVDEFWNIIEEARTEQDDKGSIAHSLTQKLRPYPPDDILRFGHIFYQYSHIADTWLMWSAANLFAGDLSDDGFMDFRSWLVGRGHEIYRQVMANPDTLADLDSQVSPLDESLMYAASTAYDSVREAGSPDYYDCINAVSLSHEQMQEITGSIRPHPEHTRRVETLADAEELLPRCNAKYASSDHDYNTWLHPADFYDLT